MAAMYSPKASHNYLFRSLMYAFTYTFYKIVELGAPVGIVLGSIWVPFGDFGRHRIDCKTPWTPFSTTGAPKEI
jgi:hypothetical protein